MHELKNKGQHVSLPFWGLWEALKRNDRVFKVKILVSLDQFRLGTFKTFSHLLTPSSSKNAKISFPPAYSNAHHRHHHRHGLKLWFPT